MTNWPHSARRGLAIANLVFAAVGFYMLRWLPSISKITVQALSGDFPNGATTLRAMFWADVPLLALLAAGGVQLLRSGETGVALSRLVYGLEIAYGCLVFVFPSTYPFLWAQNPRIYSLSRSIFGYGVVGIGPLLPQMIVLYPVVGLLVLRFIRRGGAGRPTSAPGEGAAVPSAPPT